MRQIYQIEKQKSTERKESFGISLHLRVCCASALQTEWTEMGQWERREGLVCLLWGEVPFDFRKLIQNSYKKC